MSRFFNILIILLAISCNQKKDNNSNGLNFKENNIIYADFNFPDTVKVGEDNLAIIKFKNTTFDTIILPTERNKKIFRHLLFKEFYSVKSSDVKFGSRNYYDKKFKDSIVLYDNEIYIRYNFENVGIYEIGGLVEDYLVYNYGHLKPDSAEIYRGYDLVTKVIVVTEK